MAHFAKVNNGIVERVIVAEQEFIDSYVDETPGEWIQTSYNTRGGIYYTPHTYIPDEDQSKALRKNYAGIGFTYDAERDAFIPPKPFPSWVLDEFSCLWKSPIDYPDETNNWKWNEDLVEWENIAPTTDVEPPPKNFGMYDL
jgi:hypothetical protein